jgi:hypothetical protein
MFPADQSPVLSAIKSIKSHGIIQSDIGVVQAQADALTDAGAKCIFLDVQNFLYFIPKLIFSNH